MEETQTMAEIRQGTRCNQNELKKILIGALKHPEVTEAFATAIKEAFREYSVKEKTRNNLNKLSIETSREDKKEVKKEETAPIIPTNTATDHKTEHDKTQRKVKYWKHTDLSKKGLIEKEHTVYIKEIKNNRKYHRRKRAVTIQNVNKHRKSKVKMQTQEVKTHAYFKSLLQNFVIKPKATGIG